jgi:maltokinase
MQRLEVQETFWVRREVPGLAVVLVQAHFDGGPPATYQLVLGLRPWDRRLPLAVRSAAVRVPVLPGAPAAGGPTWAVYDAFTDPVLSSQFLRSLADSRTVSGDGSDRLHFRLLHPPLAIRPGLEPRPSAPRDESQSTVLYGEEILIKVLRRIWPGVSPEVELLEALDKVGFRGIARPLGMVEATLDGASAPLAVAQTYLRNGTDGFSLALTSLRDLYSDLLIDADGALPLPSDCRQAVEHQGGSFAGAAAAIGTLTAEMHLALARLRGSPELEAGPLTRDDLQGIAAEIDSSVEKLLALADARLEPLAVHATVLHDLARQVIALEPSGAAIRIHGDYHLGQLLMTDSGWHALDFEGRPSVPIAARRRRHSPIRDLAGMLRSFDYAASVALRQQVNSADVSAASLAPFGRAWSALAREAFMHRYLALTAGSGLLPDDAAARDLLLTTLQAGQALYEIDYELRNRPDWVAIPLEGMARLLNSDPG